jgi:hypothetical protein
VLYFCASNSWIPTCEAVELMQSAPGNRALMLYRFTCRGWLLGEKGKEQLET